MEQSLAQSLFSICFGIFNLIVNSGDLTRVCDHRSYTYWQHCWQHNCHPASTRSPPPTFSWFLDKSLFVLTPDSRSPPPFFLSRLSSFRRLRFWTPSLRLRVLDIAFISFNSFLKISMEPLMVSMLLSNSVLDMTIVNASRAMTSSMMFFTCDVVFCSSPERMLLSQLRQFFEEGFRLRPHQFSGTSSDTGQSFRSSSEQFSSIDCAAGNITSRRRIFFFHFWCRRNSIIFSQVFGLYLEFDCLEKLISFLRNSFVLITVDCPFTTNTILKLLWSHGMEHNNTEDAIHKSSDHIPWNFSHKLEQTKLYEFNLIWAQMTDAKMSRWDEMMRWVPVIQEVFTR